VRSLLSGVTAAQVDTDPFPHVVIRGALEPAVADALLAALPPVEVITEGAAYGSNEYHQYSAGRSLRSGELPDIWREFIECHVSPSFARQVFDLFDEHLEEPVRRRVNATPAPRYGVRGFDDNANRRILLDAQVVLNTPVTEAVTSVKGPHVDRPRTFYGATYYLRSKDDTSEGGALQLLRLRGSRYGKFDGPFVSVDDVEVVKTIPYEHNVFVCWPNSIDALHAVSARSITPSFRYYANLLAEQQERWYDLGPYQRNPLPPAVARPPRHASRSKRLVRRVLSKVSGKATSRR
jgi:hypothetical protein